MTAISQFKDIIYFDINKEGITVSETNSDVEILTNEQSVLESVFNIILTQPTERVMNPTFGCNLNQFLFQHITIWYASRIADEILSALKRDETRIENLDIIVTPLPDEYTFEITIVFNVNTNKNVLTLSTKLNKIR